MRVLSGCRPLAGHTLSGFERLKEEAFSPMGAVFSGFGRWRLAGRFGGVGFAVDGFELLDADLGVNGGGF